MRILAMLLILLFTAVPALAGDLPADWEDYVPSVTLWPSLAQTTSFEPIPLTPEALREALDGATDDAIPGILAGLGLPEQGQDAGWIADYGVETLRLGEQPVGGARAEVQIVRYGTEQTGLSFVFLCPVGGEWALTDCIRDLYAFAPVSDIERTNTWLVGSAYGSGTGFWVDARDWYNLHTRAVEVSYVAQGHNSWSPQGFAVVRTTDDRVDLGDGTTSLHQDGYLTLRRYASAVHSTNDTAQELARYAEAEVYAYDKETYALRHQVSMRLQDIGHAALEWMDAGQIMAR